MRVLDMGKQITIVYLENNPLDRAVLDLHVSQDPELKLRYSYGGCLVDAEYVLKHVLERTWQPSNTMILFDLGLSGGSENLLPDPAVRKILGSQFLTKYLTSEGRSVPPDERLESFKKTQPAAWAYVEKIEGLSTLLKVRFARPDILCGIVSHYVSVDIRPVLEAFVMHGWPIDSIDYDLADQPKPLVIHKGELVGINQRLKSTWDAWQAVRIEFYCKDVVQNSLTQAVDGPAINLAARVQQIRNTGRLKPDDNNSPMFICDFLGLLDLPQAPLTLERLLKRVFLKIVKTQDFSKMERTGQYLFLDTEDRGALGDAVKRILAAHNRQNPEQLVCVVRGKAGEEADAPAVFESLKVSQRFCYTIPSLAAVMSAKTLYDTFEFNHFVNALVTSACEHASFVREAKVEVSHRFLADVQGWLKKLPKEAVPGTLSTFWTCACDVFEKQIQTQKEVEALFREKAKKEMSELEWRAGARGFN